MFFKYFFEFIALFFLFIFLIKLLNPKVFPMFKETLSNIGKLIRYTVRLWFESSLYTISILFTKTIYVIGMDLVIAVVFDLIVTTSIYPHFDHFSTWFHLFSTTFIPSYIISFFYGTYVIGLFDYLKEKENIKTNFFTFIQNKFRQKINQGTYTYDEEEQKYTFRRK